MKNWLLGKELVEGKTPLMRTMQAFEMTKRDSAKFLKLFEKSDWDHSGTIDIEELFGYLKMDVAGIARKPDPSGALAIAGQVGVAPDQTVFVGDSNVDIATAVQAEMLPVGVLWGFRGEDELRAAGAQHLVSKPHEIVDLI